MPVNRKIVEKNPEGWFQDIKNYVGNGPFKIVKWEHSAVMELVPNENYWRRDQVKLDKLVLYLIDNRQTALSMFETGQLDWFDDPPISEIPRLEKEAPCSVLHTLAPTTTCSTSPRSLLMTLRCARLSPWRSTARCSSIE